MQRRVTPLTSGEAEALAAYRDHTLARGLATGSTDRPAMEAAVRRAYTTAGFSEPPLIVWMDSPLGGAYAVAVLKRLLDGGQLRDQLRDQLQGQLGGQLGGQLWGQLGDQLWGQLGGQLQYGSFCWGGQDLYWLGWLDFARHLGVTYGPEHEARLDAMLATGDLGWWWPCRGFAVLTDRPISLYRDPSRRLHKHDGMAVQYADGWGIHAWHGTRVPADMLDGDGWNPERIMTERNTEIRRCAIERLGWDQFIQSAGLKLVASSPDPGNSGQDLHLYDLGRDLRDLYPNPARILLCTNGTPERDGTRRRFGLPVPAHHRDPVAAAAELYDWPSETYRQLTRRT